MNEPLILLHFGDVKVGDKIRYVSDNIKVPLTVVKTYINGHFDLRRENGDIITYMSFDRFKWEKQKPKIIDDWRAELESNN